MKVTQLHTLVNTVTQEILGESGILLEDLSNVVNVGKSIIDADAIDNYAKKLTNHIGKVVFVDRIYNGSAPTVLMDAWEYGSILEKVSCDLPDATENDTWNLTNGTSYDQSTFHAPTLTAKFFNNKVCFEIPLSFTERQIKESFSNPTQLNGFVSMLMNAVENALTVKIDSLIMRTINHATAQLIADELMTDNVINKSLSTNKAINLLTLYNASSGKTLTVAKALTDADFIRFATYQIGLFSDRMTKISTLFNLDGKERFTPLDRQKIVLLSDFAKASETFLRADTFNADKVALPVHDSVSYWQGSGLSYAFDDVSKIHVKTSSNATIDFNGILGVIFDRDALGVSNLDRRVTTAQNAKGEFYTNFYKFDAGYFNDFSENFILFYIGEKVAEEPTV